MVVAETDAGHVLLLGPADLETCDGSIDRLVEAIEHAADTPRPDMGASMNAVFASDCGSAEARSTGETT